ncbi:MAG: hypothetical protein K9I85_15750 [Saprospiraceae bacterium]|nr:hypothetical protein [Saprospiraceae bacterium]
MNLKDIQRELDAIMHEQNRRKLPEFAGYSPTEMYEIIYQPFEANSPIQLKQLHDTDYQQIPILNLMRYLLHLVHQAGEIKLTKTGCLPTRIVSDIYDQRFFPEKHLEAGFKKLYKEQDSTSINLTRHLCALSGFTKKRNGKLSLTKAGTKALTDNAFLLETSLSKFVHNFNWAYYDGYGENHIGQLGFGFSLILLDKYGHEKQLDTYYAEKYFNAFPQLSEGFSTAVHPAGHFDHSCYSLRTFERFMSYFNLVQIEYEGHWINAVRYVTKTAFFDRWIQISPPE